MTKFEEKKKEAYEKASMKQFGNADGSRAMRYLLNELENAGLLKEQQALPVVPEYVGKYIEECKKEGDCLFGIFADATRVEHDMPDLVYFWLGDEGNNDELFARAWLDGYTIEKPQLFYLVNTLTRQYLYRRDKVSFGEQGYCKDYDDKPLAYCLFTKQEIDSMQTGSYEQIEVEK